MGNEKWGFGQGSKFDKEPFDQVIVEGRPYDLLFGEHPHSRSDNNIYARSADGEIEAFEGHRIRMRVDVEDVNYLKESEWSGDEIRKGGAGRIFADDVQVYGFFHRDAVGALLKAHRLIAEISERAPDWFSAKERDKMIGRKIWYERTPAIIDRLVVDQGCLIITPDGLDQFPQPVSSIGEDDCFDDERDALKVEVIDQRIWWWRKPQSSEDAQ